MSELVLPGQQQCNYSLYGSLIGLDKIDIAMLKIPVTLLNSHPFKEGETIVFFLLNPIDAKYDTVKFTRYELYSCLKQINELESYLQQVFKNGSTEDVIGIAKQNGYVFLPKSLRDGRHGTIYYLSPVEKEDFEFKTENGMYEEVYWSPFGDERGALQQEKLNAEINPQLRRYNQDGLDNPDFL